MKNESAPRSFKDCLAMLEKAREMDEDMKKRMDNPQTAVDVLRKVREILRTKL
jgi:hypothetical protein